MTDRPPLGIVHGFGDPDPQTPAGAVYVRLKRDRAHEYPTLSAFTWYRVVSIDPRGEAWIDCQDDDEPLLLPANRIGAVKAGKGTEVPSKWPSPE